MDWSNEDIKVVNMINVVIFLFVVVFVIILPLIGVLSVVVCEIRVLRDEQREFRKNKDKE